MAAVAVDDAEESGRRRDAARKYPPAIFVALAIVLAFFVLPSSLTLPQANPSQTVEIAPVPPDDETPPPVGNLSSLSLGSSDSTEGEGAPGGEGAGGGGDEPGPLPDIGVPPPPLLQPGGGGRNPSTKKCVQTANGVRQTEDIISPPCNAFFEGDNGGATYQGVTADEVRVVLYADGGVISTPTPRGTDNYPTNVLVDMDAPPQPNETGDLLTLRAFVKYFNERYQTYNRRVHFWTYYSSGDATQQARLADAAQAYSLVKPFATISALSYNGAPDAYLKYMAEHGVLNFGSLQGRNEKFFNTFPKFIWGYNPTVEQQARGYVDAVCKRVAPYPAVNAGANGTRPALTGKPRKYGLVYSTDPNYPTLAESTDVVKRLLKETCGITFAREAPFPVNGFQVDPVTPSDYATTGMADFSAADINTILWPGGTEPNNSVAASSLNYQPEWFLAGDGQNDATAYGVNQAQTVWNRAWVFTPQVKVSTLQEEVCYQAYRSVDTTAADSDVQNYGCPQYNTLRQLFTGIQVAGPKLGPTSIDRGYHAIPAVESKDPRVPACFYEVNDYTCVKDAQAMWWDPSGSNPSQQQPGCWRMAEGARRYINGRWSQREVNSTRGADACNLYDSSGNINNSI